MNRSKITPFLIALTGILFLLSLAGCRSIPVPRASDPTDRNGAWAQDIAYLRDEFPRYNQSFTEESLEAFTGILDETYDSIPGLSDNEIYVRILEAVATPGDGHTSVNFMPSAEKLRRLPIRFYWFSDGLYIIRATAAHSGLLGARVESIGGTTPEELVAKMRNLIPGNESALRYESIYYLSSPDFLNGLGVIADPEQVTLGLRLSDGSSAMQELSPLPMGDQVWGYSSWRELSPLSTESQDAGEMIHILEDVALPAYLSVPNQSCSYDYMAGEKALYVQVNQNTNLNVKMSDFVKEVEAVFATNPVDSVIVDLRFNTGGNLLLTTDLVQGIPEWHTGAGDISIIVGGPTFSAGIVTAARMKYYAGERAVVVGEPAAEGLQFWAETRFFTLPNSGIRLYAAHRYHNWENTDYDRDKRHFWLMGRVGVPAGDLGVDLPVTVSFADYLAGRDTVVEAILREGTR